MKSTRILSTIILCLTLSFAFIGCKKDKSPAATCRIITIAPTPSAGNVSYNVTYNTEGKISLISSGTSASEFVYSGTTVIVNITNSGAFTYKKIITLNTNGLASNVKTETTAGGATWYNEAYTYSGTQLIKYTYTNSSNAVPSITTCTWSGGNLVTISTVASGSTSTSTLEYYADKPAQTGDYLSVAQLIQGFNIYQTKNAVKSILMSGSTINNFEYSFGADGKMAAMTITGNGAPLTYNYQYQCN